MLIEYIKDLIHQQVVKPTGEEDAFLERVIALIPQKELDNLESEIKAKKLLEVNSSISKLEEELSIKQAEADQLK